MTSSPHKTALSCCNAWALSMGCVIGWGAFVMPGTTFLPTAGPAGTAIAMGIGFVLLLCIAANFVFMMQRYPDGGGAYSYAKHVFDPHYAFMCAWALIVAYLSLMWSNASALTIVVRHTLGPLFLIGPKYTLFGYEIFFCEGLFALAFLLFCGLLSAFGEKYVPKIQTALVSTLITCIALCCVCSFHMSGWSLATFSPPFADGRSIEGQIFGIAAFLPWAFVGFETIAHSAEGFSFPIKKTFPIMVAALGVGALIYVALTCLATLSVPDGYANWREYVANIAHYRGVEGIPTFNAAKCAMGSAGLALLGLAVVATIASSLLGFMRAISRLVSTLAEDGLLPKDLGHLEKDGTPRNAIYALMALSIGIPFFGRTAISWVADITAISVSLVYLLTSACCWVLAKESGNRRIKISGLCGMGIATTVFLFSLVPNLWNSNTLAKESYLVLAAWCLLGVGAYLLTMWRRRQHERKQSPLLWIIMLFLLFFSVGVWAKSIVYEAIEESAREIARIHALELNTGLR